MLAIHVVGRIADDAGLPPNLGFLTTSAWFAWDGADTRIEGAILVLLYPAYVAAIWIFERKPPSLGEVEEIEEAAALRVSRSSRAGRDLLFVLTGIAAMSVGALILVEAVKTDYTSRSDANGFRTDAGWVCDWL